MVVLCHSRRKWHVEARQDRISQARELKKVPQSWGRKYKSIYKQADGNLDEIEKSSPIMGAKMVFDSFINDA